MSRNTIVLKGSPRYEEATAIGALTPGHLIEIDSAGKVKVQAVEGAYVEKAFAVEDALQGKTIASVYSIADLVSYVLAHSGDEIYAWLKAGENVVIGDYLVAAGDGTLIKNGSEGTSTVVRQIVAVVTEAVDLSGTGAVATRINIRVM